MSHHVTPRPKSRRTRSVVIGVALALAMGVVGPGISGASAGLGGATADVAMNTATCLQIQGVHVIFLRTSGTGDLDIPGLDDEVQKCMPQVATPGVPGPQGWSVEDPPAPPNIDDTVVPGGLMPSLDHTLVNVADNSNSLHPTPENECKAGWHFDITKKLAPQFAPGNNSTYTYINGSDHMQSKALVATRTKSGSVKLEATAEVEVEESTIISSVKAKFGITVSGEIGWEESLAASADVGAYKTGHLTWGIMRYVTVGHYYHHDCSGQPNIDKGTITVYSPWTGPAAKYEEE